jgi:ABC-2 type transport system ATP-binding protein
LAELSAQLQHQPGVEQVVAWGNELRICGTNAGLLQQAASRFPAFTWQPVNTSLEEVFIHLVGERAVEMKSHA